MKFVFPTGAFALFASLILLASRPDSTSSEIVVPGPSPLSRSQTWTLELASAPFPAADRDGGYELDGSTYARAEHYADSRVTVVSPSGWTAEGRVNLVFFFHGWMSAREEVLSDFDLRDQLEASGVKALLVVPELAVRAPDSFGGKFEDTGGFKRFIDELLSTLDAKGLVPKARAGSIVLAGHSGAYRVIASILRRGGLDSRIREVWLFDALYAREEAFADWIGKARGRFICVSLRGGDTAARADELVELLSKRGISPLAFDEGEEALASRLGAPVIFITSDTDHYSVVSGRSEFRTFLSTSRPLVAAGRGELRLSYARDGLGQLFRLHKRPGTADK